MIDIFWKEVNKVLLPKCFIFRAVEEAAQQMKYTLSQHEENSCISAFWENISSDYRQGTAWWNALPAKNLPAHRKVTCQGERCKPSLPPDFLLFYMQGKFLMKTPPLLQSEVGL